MSIAPRALLVLTTAVALCLLGTAAQAGLAPTKTYCVNGDGDGSPNEDWAWDIRTPGAGGTTLITSTTPVVVQGNPIGCPTAGCDDEAALAARFINSVNDHTVLGPVMALEIEGDCADPSHAAFALMRTDTTGDALDLWVAPSPAGTLTRVTGGAGAGVTFNPEVYLALPEPGLAATLGAGALLVLGLSRRSERRR
ncbi:MAG: hypothetical protein AAF430_05050 [Myxococcota bacterium]